MLKDRIRAARKATGKTQKEIAAILGVTESTYCGYETGKRQPDAIKVAAIAAALGVTGDYLLNIPEISKAPETNNDENLLVSIFRSLTEEGKALVIANAQMLAGMPEYKK